MSARAVTIVIILAALFPLLLIGCAMVGAAVGVRVCVTEVLRYLREGLPNA